MRKTMRIRLLSSIISLHALAALTGCGGGSSGASEPEQQFVTVPPKKVAGFWQGTTAGGRVVSGVVTEEGDYWLVYTANSSSQAIAGFYTGDAIATSTTPPDGTFVSANLRDASFATGEILIGEISVPVGATTNYRAKETLKGSLDEVDLPVGIYKITGSFPVTATISGASLSVPFSVLSGNFNPSTGTGSWSVAGDVSGMGMGVMTFDQTFTLDATTGLGVLNEGTNCVGNAFACAGLGPNFKGPINAGGPIVLGLQAWAVTTPSLGTPTFAPILIPNALSSITADSLDLQYNDAYEITPSLETLAGNYTGTAGVGEDLSSPDTATLHINGSTIDGDATINGEACHYVGTAAVHPTGGNVYDITLTVSNCSAATGEFAGVATYDTNANRITVTAITSAAERDKAVLFVGTKP